MTAQDLGWLADWLRQPHVARWWLQDKTVDVELAKLATRLSANADSEVHLLIVEERIDSGGTGQRPIGWCQWYRYDAHPNEAAAVDARPEDCGLDYVIGDPDAVGRGLGAELLAALLAAVRDQHPGCGFVVVPEAENVISRHLLERAGFRLQAVRTVATEPHDRLMAIYSLDGTHWQS